MSRMEDNEQIIMDRIKDCCEGCREGHHLGFHHHGCRTTLHWHCDRLIEMVADRDGRFVSHTRDIHGKKMWFYTVAGVEVPMNVVDHYFDYMFDRQAEMGICSSDLEREMYTGRLEEARASLHMAILNCVGWQMLDMSIAARIFCRVLELRLKQKAKYTKFKTGMFKDWVIDDYYRIDRKNGGHDLRPYDTPESERV